MLQRNIFEPVMKQGFRLRPDILSGCLPFRDRYKFVDLLSSFVSFSFFFLDLGISRSHGLKKHKAITRNKSFKLEVTSPYFAS